MLLLGRHGLLGSDLWSEFDRRKWSITGPKRGEFDPLIEADRLRLARRSLGEFDWVVNAAAYTDVDGAESHVTEAMAGNAILPGALAASCAQTGWRFLHVCSDYVYDGTKGSPYTESDPMVPLSIYGKSKMMGAQNVLGTLPEAVVIRTSWLYGVQGRSFPRTMVEAFEAGKALKVVSDQSGCPTSTRDLARVIADVIAMGPAGGTYHACGPETRTWHGLATETLTHWCSLAGKEPPNVESCTTQDWPTAAKRPASTVLSTSKLEALGIRPMRPLSESLAEFARSLRDEKTPED